MNIFLELTNPNTLPGAIFYGVLFLGLAMFLSILIRRAARQVEQHLSDITGVHFGSVLLQGLTYIIGALLYAHLIPELRALATTLLAGISVTSVVIGLAAQQTLGNLIAGLSLVLYRPIRIGDTVQINSPKGLISAKVESIALGFTILSFEKNAELIVPNTIMMNSILIRVNEAKSPSK